ncbi:MAG: hypothetical protein ABSC92_16575 [Rhizomicrobium sp.]|jgi:hypothetical protein
MRGFGYFLGPAWHGFRGYQPRPWQERIDAGNANENAPTKVLSEMAVVFGTSLAVVLLIDVAVLLISVPLKVFHLG